MKSNGFKILRNKSKDENYFGSLLLKMNKWSSVQPNPPQNDIEHDPTFGLNVANLKRRLKASMAFPDIPKFELEKPYLMKTFANSDTKAMTNLS